jgi:predicted ATPase/DNA-binding winged helix-turn-helix (wHTH) protein
LKKSAQKTFTLPGLGRAKVWPLKGRGGLKDFWCFFSKKNCFLYGPKSRIDRSARKGRFPMGREDGRDDDVTFGPFRLSPRRRVLATAAGPVAVGARAFDLLATLLARPGQILSKNELLDLVWPGVIVEENNLHVQMVALRRALGEHHGLIQTVPGRGYRFAGDIFDPAKTSAVVVAARSAEPVLPAELSRLIGREAELAELSRTLDKSRLVTLAGPSGIGKTRLAVALGHQLADKFPGGARLIDLAPIADPGLVEGAVAAALGLRLAAGTSAAEAIAGALGTLPSLLIVDNCEHMLGAAAPLAATLLHRCAALTIIATSQEPLRLGSETVFRLDPLALPPRHSTTAELESFGAVALFVRRVEAADRHFRLTSENGAAVAEICRQLDGIPLALEMAAARVRGFGVEALRARLKDRLKVLTAGGRATDARHRTLRGTVAWSFDLLDEADQAVFRRLGIFAGGFSAEAAVAILARERDDEWTILDAIFRLIEKSLVVVDAGEPPRYRLLETPRLFALEQLEAHGETAATAARHAAYFEAFLAGCYEAWETTPDEAWLARAAPELDNVRAALDWALGCEEARGTAISLAGAAARLWDKMALLGEGRRYLERAEALVSDEAQAEVAARLFRQIGNFWHTSDRPRALAALGRAEALHRATGDRLNLGAVLALMGPVRSFLGQQEAGASALQEAREILEHSVYQKSLLNVFNNLGVLAVIADDMKRAREHFERALSLARRAGAASVEVRMLLNLAEAEFLLGHHDAAAARGHAAVSYMRGVGSQGDLGWALVNLAAYQLVAGRRAEAVETGREALTLARLTGGYILRACLQRWALLAAMADEYFDAARLTGFINAGHAAAGESREPTEQRLYDDLVALLKTRLSQEDYVRLMDEGAALQEAQAVAMAEGIARESAPRLETGRGAKDA